MRSLLTWLRRWNQRHRSKMLDHALREQQLGREGESYTYTYSNVPPTPGRHGPER